MFRAGASRPAVASGRPRALGRSGAPGLARSRSPAAWKSTARALGSDGRPLPARTPRASGARREPSPCSAPRPGDQNPTGPEPPGATCPSPAQRPQGGGARPPAAEARTFTPTFCFASGLARLWHRPGQGDPDPDVRRPRMLPPSPRRLGPLCGELSSHPQRGKWSPRAAPRQPRQQRQQPRQESSSPRVGLPGEARHQAAGTRGGRGSGPPGSPGARRRRRAREGWGHSPFLGRRAGWLSVCLWPTSGPSSGSRKV